MDMDLYDYFKFSESEIEYIGSLRVIEFPNYLVRFSINLGKTKEAL